MASRAALPATQAPPPLLPEAFKRSFKGLLLRLMGLTMLILGLLALMALASFDPGDPSFNQASGESISNLLGSNGARFADIAFQAFGLASAFALFPFCTHGLRFAWGLNWVYPQRTIRVLMIGTLLLALGLGGLAAPTGWPFAVSLGGLIGDAMGAVFAAIHTVIDDMIGLNIPAAPVAWLCLLSGACVWLLGLGIGLRSLLFSGAMARQGLAGAGKAVSASAGLAMRGAQALSRAKPHNGDADIETAPTPPRPRRKAKEAASPAVKRGPILVDMPKARPKADTPRQVSMDLGDGYRLPDLDLLAKTKAPAVDPQLNRDALEQNARLLETVLSDFGIKGDIVGVKPGPVVTLYELEPAAGIKASRVIGLADDIARSMSAVSARIAVVPGRTVIGIELPNEMRQMVSFRELVSSDAFQSSRAKLPMILGKNIGGGAIVTDLAPMPHLLIAGATGAGKSVGLNAMILSMLFKLPPAQCRLIMIDPKMLELSVYDDIPHLLAPVVTDPRKAVVALKWVVREMEDRYAKMSKIGVRNLEAFNQKVVQASTAGVPLTRENQTYDKETGEVINEVEELDFDELPLIVVIVDELADLMVVAGKDIEGGVQRLAQMARAAGIHLILATQRPSVDVITGVIKANLPTRISFQVTSKVDSRTILEQMGAEQLLGRGDMLFMEKGKKITRVHGPFVSDEEVEKVVAHLKKQGRPEYIEAVTIETDEESGGGILMESGDANGGNNLYDRAVHIVLTDRKASTSYIQRKLQIGYNRAANLIERMEQEGVISPANHAGKREILVDDHG
ncbi:MAG: DNA translocase FtsK 4TM domain-containing protein [Pseudomonadota bacterium]